MKLTAEEQNKPMENWGLKEWHKFFKQNSTISKYWADWKDIAKTKPSLLLEEDLRSFVARNGGNIVYDEIQNVLYFLLI